MSDSNIKQIMKDKLGELVSLDIDKIQISEFNTRCQFVDESHVKTLMKSIEEHGYIPKSAVWVNAVKGPDGEIITYRLVAGRHRYEASRRLGLPYIPSQLYYNLTDEEECTLDEIDNKLDEAHKPADFLSVAEHYKYLRDVKEWSQRQIAKAKSVSRTTVRFKLGIADLSNEVKELLRGGHPDAHLYEKYFQFICKLKETPHHILICKEIIASNLSAEDSAKKFPELKFIPSPMKQKDIETRVQELLAVEKEGKIIPEAVQFSKDSSLSETEAEENQTSLERQSKAEQLYFDIYADISPNRATEFKPKEFRFSILPMWVKHTDLVINMCSSGYMLLQELIGYDFRYKPEKDRFFFIKHSSKYNECSDFLAHIAGVKTKTLYKKILPGLKDYVSYRKTDETMKFQINWDGLFEVYKREAREIPFDDGGLMDIPANFSGCLRPTPYHSINIKNGRVVPLKETGDNEQRETSKAIVEKTKKKAGKKDYTEDLSAAEKQMEAHRNHFKADFDDNVRDISESFLLEEELREMQIAESQIKVCLKKSEETENILKYIQEMSPAEKDKISNIPGYIFSLVKGGFKPPENFETVKAAEERKKKKKNVEEFGEYIKDIMDNGKALFFSPAPEEKYKITSIPNSQIFLYKKKGMPVAGSFKDWLDEKYFNL